MDRIFENIADYIMIHWKVFVFTALSFLFLDNTKELFQTILVIVGLELIALQIYEYIIRFVVSNKFLLDKFNGEDSKFSIMETAGFTQFQAAALISAHILVSVATYSVYIVSFAPQIANP
jgi:hypothetical protein